MRLTRFTKNPKTATEQEGHLKGISAGEVGLLLTCIDDEGRTARVFLHSSEAIQLKEALDRFAGQGHSFSGSSSDSGD